MIYITGASGRLGREVLKLVPKAVPLVRKKRGLKGEIITNFHTDDLKKILSNADVLIHLAGSMDFLDYKKLWRANVELTRRIMKSTPKTTKIIFASSISVYGKNLVQNPATERTLTNPDSPYSKSKLFAEKSVKKRKNYVILRIGTIYGGQYSDYKRVLNEVKKGRIKLIGNGTNKIPFVYVKDVANVIKNSIKKGQGIYNIVGPEKTQREIYKIASTKLGVDLSIKVVSPFIALLFSKAEELKARISGVAPKITSEHILILSSNRIFNCSKAKRELNFKPVDLDKGIEKMLLSM